MRAFEWPCYKRHAHGPHMVDSPSVAIHQTRCEGVRAHPDTMIGRQGLSPHLLEARQLQVRLEEPEDKSCFVWPREIVQRVDGVKLGTIVQVSAPVRPNGEFLYAHYRVVRVKRGKKPHALMRFVAEIG